MSGITRKRDRAAMGVEALRPREQDDWTHFNRLHLGVLDEAERFHKKKRRKAAGKKGQRKRSGAKSEGV